jgi:putative protein-disulfide isomerase
MMHGAPRLTLEFFHDVVCGWCFNLSPRLRVLTREFDLDIRHRTYVLQDSPERMVASFGSPAAAKETILGHWAACAAASETPERFAIERMRAAPFDYPHGLPSARACQVAQQLGGQNGHWRMFDALQEAHLSQGRNIADHAVLLDVASGLGFDLTVFRAGLVDSRTHEAVEADRALARGLGVRSVPTVIIRETGQRLRNGSLDDLRAQLKAQVQSLARLPVGGIAPAPAEVQA